MFFGQSVSRHAKIWVDLSDHNIVSRDEKDWGLPDYHFMRSYPSRKIYLLVINLAGNGL